MKPTSTSNPAEPLTLGDVLADCGVERKQIAQATRVSLSMVDSWIAGTRTVSHLRLRMMVTRGPQALADSVFGWMARGTNRRIVPADSVAAAEHDRLTAAAEFISEASDVVVALAKNAPESEVNKQADEAFRALEVARLAGTARPNLKIA